MQHTHRITHLASRTIAPCIASYDAVTSDHACNEHSPIPTFYEWDIATNLGTPPPLIWISTFSGKHGSTPALLSFTFDELESYCRELKIQVSNDGAAFSPITFIKSQCGSSDDACCSFLAYEFDFLPEHVTADDLLAGIPDCRSFCYSTSNHRSFANGGYYCVVIEMSESVSGDNHDLIAHKFSKRFGNFAEYIDLRSLLPTHKFEYPRIKNTKCEFNFECNYGESLDVYEYLGNVWGAQ